MTDHIELAEGSSGRCTGVRFRRLLDGGVQLLARRSGAINNLNVFPVPDGDTGTNMLLTMRAAMLAADEAPNPRIGAVAVSLAHGALMGARGNSGVILSQYLRGFARGVGDAADVDGPLLARALGEAARAARAAVTNPVEGTMLTVGSDLAAAAAAAATSNPSVESVLDAAVAEAREAVKRTRDLLPVLRQADVVDAGGMGLATLIEGMRLAARGEPLPEAEEIAPAVAPAARLAEATYGYCTEFLVHGAALDVEAIRDELRSLGDSLLVVGDLDLVRVHLHTFQPGRAIDLALARGGVDRVKIDNMQEQNAHIRDHGTDAPAEEALCGLVAVAVGSGFCDLYRSLGATVVFGGQTLNPSTDELLRGLRAVTAREYVLLPNNPNVLLTAEQARSTFDKPVLVVPTRDLAEGIAAAVVFQSDQSSEQNRVAMARGMAGLRTGHVTTAVRAARIDGRDIAAGAIIGLVNNRIEAVGDKLLDVTLELLTRMDAARLEIITLYAGEGLTSEAASALHGQVRDRFSKQQVDLVGGGQPHYPLILACE